MKEDHPGSPDAAHTRTGAVHTCSSLQNLMKPCILSTSALSAYVHANASGADEAVIGNGVVGKQVRGHVLPTLVRLDTGLLLYSLRMRR